MKSVMRYVLRFVLGGLGVTCIFANDAHAVSDVQFTGTVGYRVQGGQATLTASEITNYSFDEDSGELYLTLWMTESPDPYTPGYEGAQDSIGASLPSRTFLSEVSVTTEFNPPPAGTYYVHLYVSEYPDTDTALDIITFTGTETFLPDPPPPPPPVAESIDIVGDASYLITGDQVNIQVDRIENNTSRTTGTLHLSLKMTESSSPNSSGHLAARVSLENLEHGGILNPGEYYYALDFTTEFSAPPPGDYFVHLYVSESPNLDTMLDVLTDPEVHTIAEGSVELLGAASYLIGEETVTLEVDQIVNNSSETTGTLHLTLRMTPGVDSDSAGHDVARASLSSDDRSGRLASGESYEDVVVTADYTPPPDGTYWLHLYVSQEPDLSQQLDVRTSYSQIKVASDDHGDTQDSATAVTPPTSIEGNLEISADIDLFEVTLTEPGTLRAWTEGVTDTYGTLTDGSNDEVAAIDDDSGIAFNFDIERTLEAGTWYVRVEGARRHTVGSYTLNLSFEAAPERTPRPRFSADRHLGDFNGDGKDDFLLRHSEGAWHYFAMNGGDVIEAESGETDITSHLAFNLGGMGDFNGDGKDDLLLRNVDGSWYYAPMNGRTVLAEQQGEADVVSDLEYIVAGIGDFNGDGKDDLLMRHELFGSWLIAAMNGREIISDQSGTANLTIDLAYSVAGVADFNGDGIDDVLLRHEDGDWYLYIMQGRKFVLGTGPVAGIPSNSDYILAGIADFGGDGKADVLLRDGDGNWLYYAMDGREVLAEEQGSVDLEIDAAFKLEATGDLNGDGTADLLLRNSEGVWRYVPLKGRQPLEGGGELALDTNPEMNVPIHGAPSQLRPGKVTGILRIAEGHSVDSDTFDIRHGIVPNNTRDEAQVELVPAAIGGYAHARFDQIDVYRLAFPAPVRINLAIADAEDADLDLYLSELDGTIIEQSLGVEDLEVIQTTLEGEHLVLVSAYSGGSNYSLVVSLVEVGENESSSTVAGLRANRTWSKDGEFVPGELLAFAPVGVKAPEPRISVSGDLRTVAKELNIQMSEFGSSGVALLNAPTGSEFANDIRPLVDAGFRFGDPELRAKATTLMLRKRLRARGVVEFLQLNYLYRNTAIPNDAEYRRQWHYREIALEQAWNMTTGSDDVVVAVVDSGVLLEHPDLEDRWFRDSRGAIIGYDFVSDSESSGDGDGIDSNPTDEGDGAGYASSFHGSHVAGTVAADTDNETGVAGVMWQGKIMPVRVLGLGGSGTSRDVIEGIRYAAGLNNASNTLPERRANIINLSLGASNELCLPLEVNPAEQLAIRAAIEAGVVVVHAAGNDDCHHPSPISAIEGVISVGATDSFGDITQYSNYGPELDVVAPGGGLLRGVYSTSGDDSGTSVRHTYRHLSGTSMAAPHVAGVFGLMIAENPDLTPTDINRLIAGNHSDPAAMAIVRDVGARGRDDLYGHGMIDAYRAVRTARVVAGGNIDDEPAEPHLRVSPSSLNFGTSTERLRVRAANIGGGELRVESAASEQPWIRIFLDNLPEIVVEVDRTGQPEGTLVGEVTVTSNGGLFTVRVSAQVQSQARPSDFGTVFVALIEPSTQEWKDWKSTYASEGYRFESFEVPPGRYWVIAGTDRDGDDYICDPGEACGMYPVLGSPNPIRVDGDQQVEFGVSIDLFAEVASQSLRQSDFEGFRIPERIAAE